MSLWHQHEVTSSSNVCTPNNHNVDTHRISLQKLGSHNMQWLQPNSYDVVYYILRKSSFRILIYIGIQVSMRIFSDNIQPFPVNIWSDLIDQSFIFFLFIIYENKYIYNIQQINKSRIDHSKMTISMHYQKFLM
jgi:hypothetical protein